jgi:hypothetical protein
MPFLRAKNKVQGAPVERPTRHGAINIQDKSAGKGGADLAPFASGKNEKVLLT